MLEMTATVPFSAITHNKFWFEVRFEVYKFNIGSAKASPNETYTQVFQHEREAISVAQEASRVINAPGFTALEAYQYAVKHFGFHGFLIALIGVYRVDQSTRFIDFEEPKE